MTSELKLCSLHGNSVWDIRAPTQQCDLIRAWSQWAQEAQARFCPATPATVHTGVCRSGLPMSLYMHPTTCPDLRQRFPSSMGWNLLLSVHKQDVDHACAILVASVMRTRESSTPPARAKSQCRTPSKPRGAPTMLLSHNLAVHPS